MGRTKDLEGRLPINNRTTIPNATHERVGHQLSHASHHFHNPGKKQLTNHQEKMNQKLTNLVKLIMDIDMLLEAESEITHHSNQVYTVGIIGIKFLQKENSK